MDDQASIRAHVADDIRSHSPVLITYFTYPPRQQSPLHSANSSDLIHPIQCLPSISVRDPPFLVYDLSADP
jgi:hypothetical protein